MAADKRDLLTKLLEDGKMFRTLAEEGINIMMISTSEIKISVVVDEKYLELGVRTLHEAFQLDQAPAA